MTLAHDIRHGDCLAEMKTLADNSVDLIATDPPYFRVKGEAWDNQWSSGAKFLEWIEALCVEWRRVLKPNGSLYVFASPQMSHGVEGVIRKHFNVLVNIRWNKGDLPGGGRHKACSKEALRSYFPASESVIFAEHFGADNMAKGEAGYAAKCDELKGFVFEPLRAYFVAERERAGNPSTKAMCEEMHRLTGKRYVFERHTFSRSQWTLPTEEQYNAARVAFANLNHGGDYLRREYDYLRREYEDLRRPFAVTKDVPYTDVWTFATVQAYKGKHVCEKPAALMEHIIASSSRPGAVVLDCFMGSNATGKAARKLGRGYIGIELDPHWVEKVRADTSPVGLPLPVREHKAAKPAPLRLRPARQLDLFALL